MKTEISNEEIRLRRYEKSFAPMLYEAAIESRSEAFSRWMPWCHENYAPAESEAFIDRSLTAWEAETEFNFAVFDRETNGFLGGVGLNQRHRLHHFFNLGYWVRTSARNRGVASGAARLLARAAFEDLTLNRIEILAPVENLPSQKTAERAGAGREGVLRRRLALGVEVHDAAIFSFIREDFAVQLR